MVNFCRVAVESRLIQHIYHIPVLYVPLCRQTKLQREEVSAEEVAQLTRTQREIQKELLSRNGQIADLQHRLMNVESDGRATPAAQRWAAVTSMADAKQALEHLFQAAAGARTDACARHADEQELQVRREGRRRWWDTVLTGAAGEVGGGGGMVVGHRLVIVWAGERRICL